MSIQPSNGSATTTAPLGRSAALQPYFDGSDLVRRQRVPHVVISGVMLTDRLQFDRESGCAGSCRTSRTQPTPLSEVGCSASWSFVPLLHRLALAGEEIVPSKEPVVTRVAKLTMRSEVKLPLAPANRPVPPVTVKVSTIV